MTRAVRIIVLAVAAACFVALRLKFNREYAGAPWHALVAGTAKLPFGHRVLVPQLVRPFVAAGISIKACFAVTEWMASVAAIGGVAACLRQWVAPRLAVLGGAAYLGVLGLGFLLRFKWPIFYPWDLPAIACIAWGLAWSVQRRWVPVLVLVVLGAANRESAVLVPVLAVLVHWTASTRAEALRWASLQLVGVVMVRFAISVLWSSNPGTGVHLYVDGMLRAEHNLRWLADLGHALSILGAFAGLPVLWCVLRRRMPGALQRVGALAFAAMAGLFVVANLYEPRAWGEPLLLLYVGVTVAAFRWALSNDPPA
ncbi:MAG: hypothetical protein AAGA54_07985 [Myxococcota bacterium]